MVPPESIASVPALVTLPGTLSVPALTSRLEPLGIVMPWAKEELGLNKRVDPSKIAADIKYRAARVKFLCPASLCLRRPTNCPIPLLILYLFSTPAHLPLKFHIAHNIRPPVHEIDGLSWKMDD